MPRSHSDEILQCVCSRTGVWILGVPSDPKMHAHLLRRVRHDCAFVLRKPTASLGSLGCDARRYLVHIGHHVCIRMYIYIERARELVPAIIQRHIPVTGVIDTTMRADSVRFLVKTPLDRVCVFAICSSYMNVSIHNIIP